MNLDLRTMMVMIAVLSLFFSGLLALAGLHAGNIRGVRQWALASLCISLGLSSAILQSVSSQSWLVVFGATLAAVGMALQYMGIQAFKEEPADWRIPFGVATLVFLQTTWFTMIQSDIASRAIANSVILLLINLACARSLLIPAKSPLRTAYWFTGVSFALFALLHLVRAIVIYRVPVGTYGLYSQLLINPVTFFAASILLLCLTFGFVLMINYRLATDLHDLAARDPLTGALNRRSLEEEADRLWARCSRTGDTLAIMMVDVDHFKSINDRYGHLAGDEVLRRLAIVARGSIRSEDYFSRYGGEEFCILLPSCTEDEVQKLAERLRQNYASMVMEIDGEILLSTVSIGVADSKHAGLEFSSLVAAADQALYRAKQEGRNRVVTYSSMGKSI